MLQYNDGSNGDDVRINVPGPKFDEPVSDGLARKERRAFLREETLVDVREHVKRQDIIRMNQIRGALHWTTRWLVRFVGLLLIAAIAVWGVHVLAPHNWRWLSPDEINNLQALLFSGAISALVTTTARQVLDK